MGRASLTFGGVRRAGWERGDGRQDRLPVQPAPPQSDLDRADVLAAGTLRTLALFERHCLTHPELVEGDAGAGRLVEEILIAIVGQNETESLFTDEALDRTVEC